jgi:hypothetical protein
LFHKERSSKGKEIIVICDNAARITRIEIGWLGSVHDNRVWSNSEINLGGDKYLDQKEYLLGDAAISTSSAMVGLQERSQCQP